MSSSEWFDLEPGEEVIWEGRPELLGYAWSFVLGILLIPLFGLGLVVIAATYLHRQHTEYVITTESVSKKTGILSRTVTDIGHENIQDSAYKQGVFARYYEFGTVQISTAGGSGVEMALEHVADPLSVQAELDRMAAKRAPEEGGSRGSVESVRLDRETIETLTAEMEATRKALEGIERRLENR